MSEPTFETLAKIRALELEWFWKPLIPYGMTTIMEGDPGVSKSFLAMYLAAQTSTGGRIFDSPRVPKQNVLLFSAEDDPAYTIRPRIEAMNGDLSRIRVQLKYSPFDDDGLLRARREIASCKPGLIIIDPLYAFVGAKTDVFKPNEIRAVLAQLNDLAASCGAALVIIRHLTKGKHDKVIYQGAGSIDVIGAARSAILVGQHPEDPELRVVAHIKHNLSPKGDSLMYKLVPKLGHKVPAVEFVGRTDLKAEDLSGSPGPSSIGRDAAQSFLKNELENGPRPSADLKLKAEKYGISMRTLDRAKKEIGVRSQKRGDRWMLSLPDGD